MGTPKLLDFGVAKLLTDDTPADGRGLGADLVDDAGLRQPRTTRACRGDDGERCVFTGVLLHVLLTGVRPYDLAGGPPTAIQAQCWLRRG